MRLITEPYLPQVERWPQTGRHILAQFDDDTIIVYQAYRPEIGHFAAQHGYFGGAFRFNRMSWIKPNFLWMMYRSGWGTKQGQEVTLAARLRRSAFETILSQAVHSAFQPAIYASEAEWAQAVKHSAVRLQWDPDHEPSGAPVARRAIQLGLRAAVLGKYAREWIVEIEDISEFVRQQRQLAQSRDTYGQLITPHEKVYSVTDQKIAARIGLSAL
jgi:hypothetical protein